MGQSRDEQVRTLRHKAEALMRRARPRAEVEPLLDQLQRLSENGSEECLFAHRHLAEMRIERNPWQAALHLRAVMQAHPNDDVLHALMGLCQALLGNFRSAVSSYRRALSITPRNPWYHHNLGHVLDVALAEPEPALTHLQQAHQLEPLEDEITASLAHCLAGTGELVEARALAFDALRASPRNADHKALLAWIERGAPDGEGPHARSQPRVERPSSATKNKEARASKTQAAAKAVDESSQDTRIPIDQRPRVHSVLALLERNMRAAGLAAEHVSSALTLWNDYVDAQYVRVTKPEVCAAAVEYAVLTIRGVEGHTQLTIAKRYGVSPKSLKDRFRQLRDVLRLAPHDPRY